MEIVSQDRRKQSGTSDTVQNAQGEQKVTILEERHPITSKTPTLVKQT